MYVIKISHGQGVKLESGASLITNGSYLLNTSLGIEAKMAVVFK